MQDIMRKIVEYEIVINSDFNSLINVVNKMITKGWQPHGGIAPEITADINRNYFQAMVKYEEELEISPR
jgi:hypothetical protein